MKKLMIFCASLIFCANAIASDLDVKIKEIQDVWTSAKYLKTTKADKLAEFENCVNIAKNAQNSFPQNVEPLIWQGICTASQCELLKISALGKAKEAKAIFEKAASINANALNGSSYTNLGVLYHRVPGWPIGFGDEKLAEENFKKALEISPENIDANYFYALFLISEDRKTEAKKHLEIAAKAPSRNRPIADAKRKEEIANALKKLLK